MRRRGDVVEATSRRFDADRQPSDDLAKKPGGSLVVLVDAA